MKRLNLLFFFAVCIAYSPTQCMRLARSAPTRNVHAQRLWVPTLAVAKKGMPSVPRRSSVSMPNPVLRLQEINTQLRQARTKKIVARCKSIAWDASGVAIVLPTVAAYYISGAGIFASLLSVPGLSPADCFDAQIPFLIMGAVHLASRCALSAESKLCDAIAKKCDEADKEALQAAVLLDTFSKERRELIF